MKKGVVMKKTIHRGPLYVAPLLLVNICTYVTASYQALRSQSNNATRQLCQRRTPFGTFQTQPDSCGITFMYQQSRNPQAIARCLFPCQTVCDDSQLLIEGSRFNNGTRNPQAWLADYFGLATDFSSTLSFKPRIRNAIVEFAAWYSCCNTGFFIDIELPLVHTRTDLHMQESDLAEGSLSYGDGYFAEQLIPWANLLHTSSSFFQNQQVPNLGSEVVFHPLTSSKFLFCKGCSTTRLSDGILRIGYDAVFDDSGRVSPYVRLSAPAGNKPQGIWVLEPLVGTGGHWGLGAGITGQACVWEKESCASALYMQIDAYAQHLFTTVQKRAFDLCNKPNSRYMLAQKLTTQRGTPQLSGASDAGVEFANEFAPIANLTYGCVRVSSTIEGEITAQCTGHYHDWQASIGYNFWARSKEKITYKCAPALATSLWALKGDAQVIGFRSTDNDPIRLAAIEQNATITQGTNNFPNGINGIDPEQNPGITNPIPATTGAGIVVTALPFGGLGQTRSSNPTDVLTLCDIDLHGSQGLSHSLFAYLAYQPFCRKRVTGYVELGGQVEFGTQCALSTWGVWTTVAVGF